MKVTKSATYDPASWAEDTTLGRRVFNFNFRLTGNEIRGWEMVNSTSAEVEPGVTECVYIFRQSKTKREVLIRVGVIELDSWRSAQQRLHTTLLHCMRPDIPRGKGTLAKTGDVSFAGQEPKTKTAASAFFTRGNLLVSAASVGDVPVDISQLAKKLDSSLREAPNKAELASGRAAQRSPRSFDVRQGKPTAVIESLPAIAAEGRWVKVIAPDGELRREDDRLIYIPERGGKKRVGQYVQTAGGRPVRR